VSTAKGQPKNPLNDTELEVKFRDCATRALPAERAGALVTAVGALDTLASVSALAALLRGE
jgi:hypothetical protein